MEIDIYSLPEWNYDGSSTGQAKGNDSEVIIKPCAVYNDPFRSPDYSFLVLCDTYCKDPSDNETIIPHKTNNRVKALEIFNKYNDDVEPMYGIEQEFFLADKDGVPLFKNLITQNYINKEWESQGDYYCGIGSKNIIGRNFMEKALSNCIDAGLNITGMNAEVAPGQWEFQVCSVGINAADQLYIMRYILNRTAESFDWTINLHPKPVKGDWNGSGCHVNFSTKNMREDNGIEHINSAIKKLSKKHLYHMENYGSSNYLRMTGEHETADYNTFTFGVANRGASIRIPNSTNIDKKGYLEDRRPASNMDPYIVTSMLLETSLE
jgi:glutamine synthetase